MPLVRRPSGLVEQTRWLFCVLVLLALVLSVGTTLPASNSETLPLGLAASIALIGIWAYRYRTRSDPIVLDLLEAAALTGFALASPFPATVFGITFGAIWFRAVYGSTRRIVLHCAGLAFGVAASIPLWGLVQGHAATTPGNPVLGPLPVMFLTVAVARHLALSLFAREHSQRRDAALAGLSHRLLGVNEPAEIYRKAWETATAICASTPNLRALVVDEHADGLRVQERTEGLESLPETLPTNVVSPAPPGAGLRSVADSTTLQAATHSAGQWLCFPLAPGGWLILGTPGALPDEALVAIESLANQVALAARTTDAHHDLTLQARTDGLTGLANRATFHAALDLGLSQSKSNLAVLFLDLDDFKTVNDELGHAAGDELLRHIARRIAHVLRPADLCARLGGDEFAILVSEADDGVADLIAQRLLEVLAAPNSLAGRPAPSVGASIGLAYGSAELSAEQLIQQADIAMYAAKAKGKNRVQNFDASLLQADAQAAYDAELHAAAAAGQLVVHYQPVISLARNSCTAVEALVRWEHPTRGLVQPLEFITAAENTGAIVAIGTFVLRQACRDAAGWTADDGTGLAVHVNVSAAQLVDPTFLETVRGCLVEFSMPPKQLVLEITESMVLDSPVVLDALNALAALGIALAIDDFGTGYSALTTLRTLPLDIVKIDRSFVAGCPTSTADNTLVEAIVQMAGKLGLETVAEGIERPEQERFLRAVGADAVQGYLHLRPVPAAEFARWLQAQHPANPTPAPDNLARLVPRQPAPGPKVRRPAS